VHRLLFLLQHIKHNVENTDSVKAQAYKNCWHVNARSGCNVCLYYLLFYVFRMMIMMIAVSVSVMNDSSECVCDE